MRRRERDLWASEGGTKAVSRPQPVRVAKGWTVSPGVLPSKPLAPRRRKSAPVRPNNRAAVALPLGGQSYNPVDEEHQRALSKAVGQLEKRKKKDDKFVSSMTYGRDKPATGNFSADKTWEEEVKEKAPVAKRKKSGATKEAKKKKTKTKKATERDAKKALVHRRHPERQAVAKEVEDMDQILSEHEAKQKKREIARTKRRAAKKENMEIKHYGRHYHTPLVLDVAPTDKLVGSLRHLNGGYVHPALERMKSLEERNLVPARMRHKYNKRKVLKARGEVRLKRESSGVMPETSF